MSIGDLHKWELLEEDSDFDEDSEEDINAKAAEKMDLSSKAAEKMDINSKTPEKIREGLAVAKNILSDRFYCIRPNYTSTINPSKEAIKSFGT